ncbi:MAG: Uma2 family endonuclease [Verrucomicrobiota bacterium]
MEGTLQPPFAHPNREKALVSELANGDSLTATEFLRRYDGMPDQKKAELIHGTVYLMASPVSLDHAEPDSLLQTWIGYYATQFPDVQSSTNVTLRLGPKEVPQPDGCLRRLPEAGGKSQVESTGSQRYLSGPPELVAEVSLSSASLDAHAKKESYLAAGISEYLLWNLNEKEILWWRLVDDDYQLIPLAADGFLKSQVFPGLWLNPEAMIALDGQSVIKGLQQGMNAS